MAPVKFRLAMIDRTRNCVVVETKPNQFYYLPGRYDPDAKKRQIVGRGVVDLTHWFRYPPPIQG